VLAGAYALDFELGTAPGNEKAVFDWPSSWPGANKYSQ
jgi:hypothetical protein